MPRIDALIVGAGLTGATAARLLADAGLSVAVVEKRGHPGGNCADGLDETTGILRNYHGGHIFHTNSPRVWQFVQRFAEWQQYTHRVAVNIDGQLFSFPVNLLTVAQVFGASDPDEARRIMDSPVGREQLLNMFFVGYSEKQWGRPWADIPGAIPARIGWRTNYDDRYFTDTWQGLPDGGYGQMIAKMLEGIPVVYGDDFCKSKGYWLRQTERVIYTGEIDALMDYRYGRLEYRSLRFEDFIADGDYQGCATVNFPGRDVPYTRILEWRHFGWHPAPSELSLCTREYPAAEGEPYYPVNTPANMRLYEDYRAALRAECPRIELAGRLARYQYQNMDMSIAQAMALVGGRA